MGGDKLTLVHSMEVRLGSIVRGFSVPERGRRRCQSQYDPELLGWGGQLRGVVLRTGD